MKIGKKSEFIGKKCKYNNSIGIVIGQHNNSKKQLIMAVLEGSGGWKGVNKDYIKNNYKVYSHENNEKGYWFVSSKDIMPD